MLNKPHHDEEQDEPKTPLERVREQQEHQQQTLAQGRADAEGQSVKAHNREVEEERVDTTPDVPGQGPPSAMRNYPQRSNQSHNQ